ncbi:hypothetical protein PHPALM_31029 [Phytophthora palmivora]|uniref:Uncharacterized protein n=1 Tax=Phytophthora palmivora TaxID=4796 RepID=A0A2P4X3N7_9STRA|nr:hypothetical protein PHPALM_31029 [Phytophthora palmivora]
MTGAALKLDKVVDDIPLMSLYFTPRQYNNLWLTMTPQAGVAIGVAKLPAVKGLTSKPWAAEFTATIVAAIALNQFIGPVLCDIGLSHAGESMYDRVAEVQLDSVPDTLDSEVSTRRRSLHRNRNRLSSSNITQGNGDPIDLLLSTKSKVQLSSAKMKLHLKLR